HLKIYKKYESYFPLTKFFSVVIFIATFNVCSYVGVKKTRVNQERLDSKVKRVQNT
ncbi:hypothetical protein L9F63_027401, partial [Diploptera punctata]